MKYACHSGLTAEEDVLHVQGHCSSQLVGEVVPVPLSPLWGDISRLTAKLTGGNTEKGTHIGLVWGGVGGGWTERYLKHFLR